MRKIWRLHKDSPFVEVGDSHVKLAFDDETYIVLNAGGITTQGKVNHQSMPTDTSYYGMFTQQNLYLGLFLPGMVSPPQYTLNTAFFDVLTNIKTLMSTVKAASGM